MSLIANSPKSLFKFKSLFTRRVFSEGNNAHEYIAEQQISLEFFILKKRGTHAPTPPETTV